MSKVTFAGAKLATAETTKAPFEMELVLKRYFPKLNLPKLSVLKLKLTLLI